MTGFMYPRTIAITRPNTAPTAGDAGYLGLQATAETAVVSNVTASIQFDSAGSAPLPNVPGDTVGRTLWKILIPASAGIANGTIQKNDVATDDLGQRYQISAPYWTPLGWTLRTELLKD